MLLKKDGITIIDLQLSDDDAIVDVIIWGERLIVKTGYARVFILEEDLYAITEIL